MPALRFLSSSRFYSVLVVGTLLAVSCQALLAQENALQRAMESLVRVNIFTSSGSPGSETAVPPSGQVLQNYPPPTIIEWIPSIGIVIDDKGHVLTFVGYRWVNIHARNPRIEIIDSQGLKRVGRLVGIDQNMRIAVIRSEAPALKKTPLCERCEIKDGVTVVMSMSDGPGISQLESAQVLSVGTIGNPSSGSEWAIRISRPLSMIGAPLLNARNQIVGIVADQESRKTLPEPAASVNIFPASQLLSSAFKIIKAGGDIQTGWLGVTVDADVESDSGVTIANIEKDSPAHRAGLLPRDVMVKWNGTSIRDARKFIQIVQDTPIGSKADIDILRQGKPARVTAIIEARKPQDPRERLVLDFPGVMALPGASLPDRDAQFQNLLGIELVMLTPQLANFLQIPWQPGLFVVSVTKQAAFDRAGVFAGDVILEIDGIRASNPQTFFDHIKSLGSGGRMVLRLLRKGADLRKVVQLPKLPGSGRRPNF
jgi:membrane-associated protease RseP (regulator of RpoE activity)